MTEILRKGYIGHPGQLATLRRVELREGRAKGTEVIEAVTAGGLALDILPDTGLDIGQARFQGMNMSWMSKNGYDSPAVDTPYENEFVNTFSGGLLYSCGLRNAGPGNRDGEEWHPLHGRIHSQPAEQVSARIEGEEIIVSGILRETAFFGHALEMKRTIRIPVFGAEVTVEDELTNQTPRAEEIMRIYHCNFGYPLLSERARLILPEERETIPRNEFSATGLGRELEFDNPIDGDGERVFFQKMKKDFRAELVNPEIGVRMQMTWTGDTLPILSEWRSMASGDYVLGLEPTNCYIMGRAAERANGTLPVIAPWETIRTGVKIAFERTK